MIDLLREVKELCCHTDRLLWESYNYVIPGSGKDGAEPGPPTPRSRLYIPPYRQTENQTDPNKYRISEQEARFLFTHALIQMGPADVLYSTETPTKEPYKFSEGEVQAPTTPKPGRSASSDLSLYLLEPGSKPGDPAMNIEFKSKGFTIKARGGGSIEDASDDELLKRLFPIRKDLEKLLCEASHGVWFHLLESSRERAIRGLFDSLRKSIGFVSETRGKDVKKKKVLIHICCLEGKFSLQKTLDINDGDEWEVTVGHALNFEKAILDDIGEQKRSTHNWRINYAT